MHTYVTHRIQLLHRSLPKHVQHHYTANIYNVNLIKKVGDGYLVEIGSSYKSTNHLGLFVHVCLRASNLY